MLTVKNKVNTRLNQKLKTEEGTPYHDKDLYFSSVKQLSPKEFPTLNVTSLGEPQSQDELENTEQNYITSTIQLKAYSNIDTTECYSLINKAGDVMIGMGYKLISGPEDISDTNYIVYARFSRIVGSGDILY